MTGVSMTEAERSVPGGAARPPDTDDASVGPHSEPGASVQTGQLLEIRILGPLEVRRRDGTMVQPGEWRTGKTSDLLQLLALQGDQPVAPQTLVDILWPSSDHQRGLTSLRTALSRIRRVIGQEHLERSLAGLRLKDAWIDAVRYRELAARVSGLVGSADEAYIFEIASEAEALYRGDLQAYDVNAGWAQTAGQSLAWIRESLLCDAAGAALALGLLRRAADLANTALGLNRFSERAIRLLMRSYAQRGELSLALTEYERCKARFAQDLGTDPSPETRELHLALLRMC
jgi:DNA-binding SARP family transcriptional activator